MGAGEKEKKEEVHRNGVYVSLVFGLPLKIRD